MVTEFAIPTTNSCVLGANDFPATPDITNGPDSNIWFTEDAVDKIGRITPEGVISEYPIPTPDSEPSGITKGPDGNLWFTEQAAGKIGRISPTGVVTEFTIPSPYASVNTSPFFPKPLAIAAGPDGNLWFTEQNFSSAAATSPLDSDIGQITTSGTITEYPAPCGFVITTGPDGNLWVAEGDFASEYGVIPPLSDVDRITKAGVVTQIPVPTPDFHLGIAVGPDGNLWISSPDIGNLEQITPAGVVTEYPIPTAGAVGISLATGPDGNLWFTGKSGEIGRLVLPTSTVAVTSLQGESPVAVTSLQVEKLTINTRSPAAQVLGDRRPVQRAARRRRRGRSGGVYRSLGQDQEGP